MKVVKEREVGIEREEDKEVERRIWVERKQEAGRTSLVFQGLSIHLAKQGTRVQGHARRQERPLR